MWMLLGLAVAIALVMFWLHRDREPEPQSSPPAVQPMNAAPPVIPAHPTITYRLTR